jgi:2,3-dimethylmalate lyase
LKHPAELREDLVEGMKGGTVVAGGCYDCLSAVAVEQAGFSCLYISGASVSVSRLGAPDVGLLGHSELVDVARRITTRASVPVISDIDTGFGGVINVARTVEEFGLAGVAAVHLEDQVFPKRCGHLAGKEVVPLDDYLAKVYAADRARRDSGMMIIARTDSLVIEGTEAAIDRANRAFEAGADVLFVEAPQSLEDIEAIATSVEGPKLFNMVAGGVTPSLTLAEVEAFGFEIILLPPLALFAATYGIREAAAAIRERGDDSVLRDYDYKITPFFESFGLNEWMELDEAAWDAVAKAKVP